MTPVLYESTETEFTTQGLGALTDCTSAVVTEERNGIYELAITYPITGVHFEDLAVQRIITAIPSPYRDPQPFRIYKVSRPMAGEITVYCNHISYDLSGIPVEPFTASGIQAAFAGLKNNEGVESNFTYQTDRVTPSTFTVTLPASARSLLGGVDGSILDIYGGEYTFDKFTVINSNARGTDRGVTIRYGKNMTGCVLQQDSSTQYVGVQSYWYQEDAGSVIGNIVYADGLSGAPVLVLDCSGDFESAPTVEQLDAKSIAYITNNDLTTVSISLEVSFIHLDQMDGFEDLAGLEMCDLCDTVTVQYEKLGVDVTAKIVSIETDVLLERYNSVTVGSIGTNLADTIAGIEAKAKEAVDSNYLTAAINAASALITGNSGGYVILNDSNNDGKPDEILIMDTPDLRTATRIWRWNKNGLGYSGNGYNGYFGLAMTADGSIVADFITSGTMTADRIRGGTLEVGGINNTSGLIRMRNANGELVGWWNNNGIRFNDGQILALNTSDSGFSRLASGEIQSGYYDGSTYWPYLQFALYSTTTYARSCYMNFYALPTGASSRVGMFTFNQLVAGGSYAGGAFHVHNGAGNKRVSLYGNGALNLKNANEDDRVSCYVDDDNDYGVVRCYNGDNQSAVIGGAGILMLYNSSGTRTVYFNGANGNGTISGRLTQGSDRKFKTDIEDIPEEILDGILDLAPKIYRLISNGELSAGFIAQEVQGTPLEFLVIEGEDGLYLDYNSLHALEVAAIQRQTKQINALEDRLTRLEAMLNDCING